MTPLILILALLAIAAVGAWGLILRNRARKLAEQTARKESERFAAERKVTAEKANAEVKSRDDARLQAEADERNRKEAEAREKARLSDEEEQRAKERRQAEERVRSEAHESAPKVAEETRHLAEEKVEEEATAGDTVTETPSQPKPLEAGGAPSGVTTENPPRKEPQIEGRRTIPRITGVTEEGEGVDAATKKAKPPREHAPVSPEDRGGRSRETVPERKGGGEKKRRTRTPKPEIVCWKREREWILAVELPDDFPERQILTVVQDGIPLENDEAENGCWRLAQLHGQVVVRVTDAENELVFTLPLGDDRCLIFKLSGDDRGRHVKAPSSGSCLAVVPEDWKRDEALAGPPRIAPEYVCLSGYRAHFFEL